MNNKQNFNRNAGHRNIQQKNYTKTTTKTNFKETKEPRLKVIALGGLEEIGKNITVFEYGNDILVVDMGFQFPDEETLGVDYILPDTTYLEENKEKLRGLLVTHGHMDHIGAIPYIMPNKFNIPIYTGQLTAAMIKKRQEEFKYSKDLIVNIVDPDKDQLKLGCFEIEFFRVNHNIPDGMGIAIKTPVGLIVYTGDYKFDHTPVDEKPTDFSKLAKYGGQNTLALFSDSTSIDKPGSSISEKEIGKNFMNIISDVKGRLIVASFSSLISRIQQVIDTAQAYGRKVAVVGRSMNDNVEIARNLQYLKVPKDIMVDISQASKMPDNEVCIITTGSQGEETSGLMRMASGDHKQVKIKKGDTVILSSSPIPGNERSIVSMMDNLIREGAKVIYDKLMDVHTGGHARQEDAKLMIDLVKPKYLVPIHGERHRLVMHGEIGNSVGIPENNVLVADNGQVMEFLHNGHSRVTEHRVASGIVMVDGLGIGDVGNIVLRDRQVMAKDGIFVVILTIDKRTGRLANSPDIISRGFVYMRESEELINNARNYIRKTLEKKDGTYPSNWTYIKTKLRDEMSKFLYEHTQRQPMVLPVVIEV
ncbi:ribonuclease J [bacterium]|nr:ribonuclease J [bacterium]